MQRLLREEILGRTPSLEIFPAARRTLRGRGAAREPEVVSVREPVLRGRGWIVAGGTALPLELVGHKGRCRLLPGRRQDRRDLADRRSRRAQLAILPGGRHGRRLAARDAAPLGPVPYGVALA